jgi:molybdenum cofactor cytidylyltransferase
MVHGGLELVAALDLRPGERVALVGGGGKTTLAVQLAAAAQGRGWTALFTTTTKLLSPEQGPDAFVVGETDARTLRGYLHERGLLYLARSWLDEWEDTPDGIAQTAPGSRLRKVAGFPPAEMAHLINNLNPDLALVEADGSRHRPFKAPADYEPVIPSTTTLLLVVAGLSVLGQPLVEAAVHRPERVADLGGVSLGTPVDPALVAAVLAHPAGGLKGCPPGARAVAVLAQAKPELLPAGREVARRLLDTGRFERVLLADLHAPDGVGEVWQGDVEKGFRLGPVAWPRVAAVVLAAGQSRRMGQNKLLLPLAGRPLVAHAVAAALGSRAAAVGVVLGAAADQVRAALAGQPVWFLSNPDWARGQATSLRAAIAQLPAWSEGVLFLTGDMPFVAPGHLDRLMEQGRLGVPVVWSGYEGGRGIPAFFGRDTFSALQALQGDVGGRALAGQYAEAVVPADFPPLDVDTAEQYGQACQWLERHSVQDRPSPANHQGERFP